MCDNHYGRCSMFEKSVECEEGDKCGECGTTLLHESGLTWDDAREKGYSTATTMRGQA